MTGRLPYLELGATEDERNMVIKAMMAATTTMSWVAATMIWVAKLPWAIHHAPTSPFRFVKCLYDKQDVVQKAVLLT